MSPIRRALALVVCLATLAVFAAAVLRPIRPPVPFGSGWFLAPARLVGRMIGPGVIFERRSVNAADLMFDRLSQSRSVMPNPGLRYAPPPQTRVYSSYVFRRPIFRIGQDYTVRADDEVRQVLSVSGNVTIEGRVTRDVVVVLGDVHLAKTAVVDGSIVVTAGNVVAESGAVVRQDLIVVGGTVDAPSGFSPEGEHIAIGATPLGDWMRSVVPWITRGLLFGRPIVPDVGWVWIVVGVFFLISVAFNLVFERPVRACATVILERPLAAILAGLIVLVLLGPIFLIMAATVVGIAVIPFVACAVAVGWMLGKVGVVRGIGARLVHQSDPDSRPQATRSVVIGFAAICLAYMVPVLGLVTWAMIGVLGLGAATMTFLTALRREPKPKPAGPAPEAPPPPATMPPGPVAPDAPWAGDSGPGPDASPAVAHAPPALSAAAYATFLDRLAAFVLDCLLVTVANNFMGFARADGPLLLWLLVYHVAFWTWIGTTMGGIVVGIKIVRTEGGGLRFVDALVRALASLFSLVALGIGCLWMIQDPERQMWHDKIAGTHVVKVPRNLLLA